MHVLVDFSNLMEKHKYGYPEYSNDRKEFNEALSAALLKVAKSFNRSETKQIVANIDTQGAAALASHFQNMQALVDFGTLTMGGGFYQNEHISLLHQTLGELEIQNGEDSGSGTRKGSLIAKIMCLRITVRQMVVDWKTSWDNLDDTIELFLDNSVTLNFEHYQKKVDSTVRNIPVYRYAIDQEHAKRVRDTFEHTISRIFARASGRASWETKLHAVKILAYIGLCILELCSPLRPPRQNELLSDHLAEDMLTDAMLSLCHSLAKSEGVKRLSDEDLVENMLELDRRRSRIPEAMEGLDGVLSVIRDPESLKSKASKRAKAAAISKTTHVIDLTDD